MMLVDSHCHLDFPDFEAEHAEIIARAKASGVGHMLTISTRVRRFDQIRQIAERFDGIFCSVGTHPHQASEERDVPLAEIVALAEHPKVVAIGEAGLDYFYQHSTREDQEVGFRKHIEAARQTGLPLVIHTRDAEEDTARILAEEMQRGVFKMVLHCFTGGMELAMRGVELGAYVSFSGILTFPKSTALRAVAAAVPLDRLLVETDAPFLAPHPNRGKRNEPAFVRHTAAVLAEVKGVTDADIARATTDNFFRLFSRAQRGQHAPEAASPAA
jgi:TatD DNase family protein